MGLRINNNSDAQNTLRNLVTAQNMFSQSMARLSSGKRINSAADDAAGYAISNKLMAQSKGLDQAQSNAQDGISMIQTAAGGLSTTQNLLQRLRQLAVQSANDTNTTSDRQALQSEADQIANEITQIASTTQFNTKNLLDGAQAATTTAATTTPITGGTAGAATLTGFGAGNTGTVSASGIANSAYTINISSVASGAGAGTVTIGGTSYNLTATATAATAGTHGTVAYAIAGGNPTGVTFALTLDGGANNTNPTLTGASGSVAFTQSGATGGVTTPASTTGGVTLQVGANASQSLNVGISAMDAFSLGVSATGAGNAAAVYTAGTLTSAASTSGALDITTQAHANAAITTIDTAISTVSTQAASLGSVQNRLSAAINNLAIGSENMTAAYSAITNVNMAQESTYLATAQILQQSSTAMLAQANQAPQGVLKLLG